MTDQDQRIEPPDLAAARRANEAMLEWARLLAPEDRLRTAGLLLTLPAADRPDESPVLTVLLHPDYTKGRAAVLLSAIDLTSESWKNGLPDDVRLTNVVTEVETFDVWALVESEYLPKSAAGSRVLHATTLQGLRALVSARWSGR